jgi:probable HAF family extracellular repeat protein
MNRCVITSSVLVVVTLATSRGFAAPMYTVTRLGTFQFAGFDSEGVGINASGQITGDSGFDMAYHAFFYDGAMHDLGTLGGATSEGAGINDSGQVTGGSFTAQNQGIHAFYYDGTMHDIDKFGYSAGLGINASGQITGVSFSNNSGPYAHAFFYDGTMHDIGTLGGQTSLGRGINASGQITGNSTLMPNSSLTHAFFYDGTMHDLGTLGGSSSEGDGINDSGQIAGSSGTASGATHAFFYDGAMHDLGTLGGSLSEGRAINSSGQIVGDSFIAGNSLTHAFVYDETHGMQDLNSLIDPLSGWSLENAYGINDRGQITGTGILTTQFDSPHYAFVLTPVPEPSSIVLVALGVMGLLGYVSSARRHTGIASPCDEAR